MKRVKRACDRAADIGGKVSEWQEQTEERVGAEKGEDKKRREKLETSERQKK